MSWLSSFFIGVLTAIVAGTAGGFLAAGCVSWYRITSREGASGYFIASIILIGLVIGFFSGLFISRYFGGFFTGLGASAGIMLTVAGLIAAIAWGLADIPPTLNGHELMLVVEARLPKGAQQPPVLPEKQFVWFESGPRFGPSRASTYGKLDTANARFEDGRWIVPGSVLIFTTRNSRRIAIALDDKSADGFELHFPGHPGEKYKQWSPWLPDEFGVWPDSKLSYRFRVEEVIPEEPEPVVDPFTKLTPESPLREWIEFFDGFGREPEKYQAILKQAEARPAELANILRSPNAEDVGHALDVVHELKFHDPQVVQAMRDMAADIASQIATFNALAPQDPATEESAARIRDRFNHWCRPWERVQDKIHSDGRAPVEKIQKLASVRTESPAMQAVVYDAQMLLRMLEQ